MTKLLPIAEEQPDLLQVLLASWGNRYYEKQPFPRSKWLSNFEDELRKLFPYSTKRERNLTARHYAPFELAQGHDVP